MRRSHRIGASYASNWNPLIRQAAPPRTADVNHDECARFRALAPAAALGGLDPDEAAFARSHLRTCARPHPEAAEWAAVAAAVGGAMPDEDLPSPALRDRLLSAARAELEARPGRGTRLSWRPIALAAGSFAIAASLLLGVQLGENRTLRAELGTTADRLTALETELGAAQDWIQRAVARGADAFFMDGEGEAAQASFMLVVEEAAAGAVLLMSGLPELAAGETYELWVERDGTVVAVGTFRADDGGLAAVAIDSSLAGIRQAMITVEPLGGSMAPNADEVIMQGDLSL
jgi:hypothetical protein